MGKGERSCFHSAAITREERLSATFLLRALLKELGSFCPGTRFAAIWPCLVSKNIKMALGVILVVLAYPWCTQIGISL